MQHISNLTTVTVSTIQVLDSAAANVGSPDDDKHD
jgi:hypothetical protein